MSQENQQNQEDQKDRELFVRNLNFGTTDFSLRRYFSRYGNVVHANVACDVHSKRRVSKGYGFVIFEKVESAQRALVHPNKVIDGRMTQSFLAAARNKSSPSPSPSLSSSPSKFESAEQEVLFYLSLVYWHDFTKC